MKFLKLSFSILLCWCACAAVAFGQLKPVGEAKTDSFPNVTLRINDRDPDKKSEEAFVLTDGEKEVKFTMTASSPKDSGAHKSILILWEYLPAAARDAQNKFFRELILSALPDIVDDGDEVNVATFAWTDQKKGEKTIALLQPGFDDAITGLSEAVKLAKAPNGKGLDAAHGSELYPAISEAIALLAEQKTATKMLIVLSAEFPNVFNPSEGPSSVIQKANDGDVAIYNLRYKLMAEKYSLNDVAKGTYGLSYEVVKDRPDLALHSLEEFAKNAVARSMGVDYAFQFKSLSPRDGKSHTLEIKAGNKTINLQYEAPGLGFGGWIQENLILFILILVLLLGGAAGLFWWMRKRGQAEAARIAEEERKLAEVENKSKENENKLQQQKSQLERIQQEEKTRQRTAEEAKRKAEIELQTQTLLKEMYANGKQPRLTTLVNGQPITMELPSPVTTVGRDATCEVQIKDQTISRTHFQVIYQNGKYTLLDLGSTNGTQLNGGRVQQSELRHGDQIKAGEAILFFYI